MMMVQKFNLKDSFPMLII